MGMSAPMVARIAPTWPSDSSTDMCTLRWLYASDADTVSVSASTPASVASSAPFTLGTSATWRTAGDRGSAAMTSAAPAMAGTALGETNAATSINDTPASTSAVTSWTLAVTGTGFSGWSPSRGPTSRTTIDGGRGGSAPSLVVTPGAPRGAGH